ncbi:MAG: hypothetical protein R2813_05870 [Flavobacteriales bacterium]
MDIKAEKVSLIEWIAQLTDESIIGKLKNLRESETDWWDEISEAERNSIQEGIEQLNRGESFSHQQIVQEAKEKYGL